MTQIHRAAIVGVGGVGSALLQPLASLLANQPEFLQEEGPRPTPITLSLIDGDKYEEKNLRNQCIQASDVGHFKADVAAEIVAGLPNLSVEPWCSYLTGPIAFSQWLIDARAEQKVKEDAGVSPGVALIVCAVDNDWARSYIYKAIDEVPNTNVLLIDPSNGAGDDADVAECYTFLRMLVDGVPVTPWSSPAEKFSQIRSPKGRDPKTSCAQRAVSQPQLRTSNMRAALFCYDAIERFVSERGMPEGYYYSDETGETLIGVRLSTQKEQAERDAALTAKEDNDG